MKQQGNAARRPQRHRSWVTIAMSLIALLGMGLFAPAAQAAPSSAQVTGSVVAEKGGSLKKVPEIEVILQRLDDQSGAWKYSDDTWLYPGDSSFAFAATYTGKHRIVLSPKGGGHDFVYTVGREFDVVGNTAVKGLKVTLKRGIPVSGSVSFANSKKVKDADTLAILERKSGNSWKSVDEASVFAGKFSVLAREAGTYRVKLDHNDGRFVPSYSKEFTLTTSAKPKKGVKLVAKTAPVIKGKLATAKKITKDLHINVTVLPASGKGEPVGSAVVTRTGKFSVPTSGFSGKAILKFEATGKSGKKNVKFRTVYWNGKKYGTLKAAKAKQFTLTGRKSVGGKHITLRERTQLVNKKRPKIVGSAKVGATLKAHPGTWNAKGAKFSYQWRVASSGKKIKGATARSFTPTDSLRGKKLVVSVKAAKAGFKAKTVKSLPSARVK